MLLFLKRLSLCRGIAALAVQKVNFSPKGFFSLKFEMLSLWWQEKWLGYAETSFFLVPLQLSEANILSWEDCLVTDASGGYLHTYRGKRQFVHLHEILCSDYNHSYVKILTDSRSRLTSDIGAH